MRSGSSNYSGGVYNGRAATCMQWKSAGEALTTVEEYNGRAAMQWKSACSGSSNYSRGVVNSGRVQWKQ